MATGMTLTQAQERFITRVNSCQTGHFRRVRRGAWKELTGWAEKHGYDGQTVCRDADDMATLERQAVE